MYRTATCEISTRPEASGFQRADVQLPNQAQPGCKLHEQNLSTTSSTTFIWGGSLGLKYLLNASWKCVSHNACGLGSHWLCRSDLAAAS